MTQPRSAARQWGRRWIIEYKNGVNGRWRVWSTRASFRDAVKAMTVDAVDGGGRAWPTLRILHVAPKSGGKVDAIREGR